MGNFIIGGDPINETTKSEIVVAFGLDGVEADKIAAEAAAATAVAAAGQAATMQLDAATWGPGTAMPTAGAIGTSSVITLILETLIPAGTVLTSLDISIAASGVGAWQLMFVSRNSDGTYNLVNDLTDQVISSTGNVSIPLELGGENYVTPVEGRLAFRRSISTAATYNFRNAASGQTYQATGKLTGNNVAVTALAVLPAYRINGFVARKGEALFDRGTFNGAAVNTDPAFPVSFSQGRHDLAVGGTTTGSTQAFFDYRPAQRSGFLTALAIDIAAAGTTEVYLMRPNGANWRCVRSFFVTTASTGRITFTAGTDFDSNIAIEKGWLIGISGQGATYTFGGSGTGSLYILNQPILEGLDYSLGTPSTQAFNIEYTVQSVALPLATMNESMGDRLRGQTAMVWEHFGGTSTPADWTIGTWTVNDGLRSPATGGNSVVAFNTSAIRWATRATWSCRFTLAASTLIQFGFGCTGESNSQYIRINAATNQVQICSWNGAGQNPVVRASRGTGFTTALGSVARDYTLTVRRRVNRVFIALTDNVNGERFTWALQANVPIQRMIGQPGFLYEAGSGVAGDVVVNWARFSIDVARDVHTLFIGDSNTDGFALADWQMPSHSERIEAVRNKGDTVTVARFGANSTNLLAELNRALPFFNTVRFVVVMIGTNDTVQGTLNTNLNAIVAAIVAKGATPVLLTLPPKSGGLYVQTNTNIRTRVYGNHPYVDLCRALTTSNDGVNWNTALALADLIHINQAGFAVLVSQDASGAATGTFANEAPYLFTDSLAGAGSLLA